MKNICIGLFEGETLPESLAAFKDVKLDLEFGKITTIHTLNQLDCEKIVVVGLGDGKRISRRLLVKSKPMIISYMSMKIQRMRLALDLYMVRIVIKRQRCMILKVMDLRLSLKKGKQLL